MEEAYLRIEDLKTQFFTSKGIVKALDGVSLSIDKGEIYGLVGESGCGKSVTATSAMDLIPDPPGRIIKGKIYIEGFNIIGDLDKLAKIDVRSETDVRIKRNKRLIKRHNFILSGVRGNKVAMIFQEPFLALNPVLRIGEQIEETILLHDRVGIANSIARREQISGQNLNELAEQVLALEDEDARRKYITRWTREYGIPDIEPTINELFSSSKDRSFILKQLDEIISEEKSGLDVRSILRARDYYKLRDQMHDLSRALITAEEENKTSEISRIQDELSSLNSELRKYFGFLFSERFKRNGIERLFKREARKRAIELLKLVNIASPERIVDSFPHELSGGMQQRAMIAMALSSNPGLLIADEPTTALDVTTQAQILELIRDLNYVMGSSVLFITHDLAVIAEMCNRVGVMYAGNVVEETTVKGLFADPKHPYTMGLMKAIPRADKRRMEDTRLESIPGMVPNLITPPSGCRFHPRCKFKMDICDQKKPKLVEIEKGHKVACFLYSNEIAEEAEN